MSLASNVNLECFSGLNFSQFISLTNDDGSAYDYTAKTFTGQIRSFHGNTLIGTMTVVGATVDGDNGIQIDIADTDTSTFSAGIYRYDIKDTDTITADVSIIVEGRFTVFNAVTQ